MTEATKSGALSRKGRAKPKSRYYEKTLLGEWLRAERKARDIEQGEFAKMLGVNKTKASRVETSEILVSNGLLARYSKCWPEITQEVLQLVRDKPNRAVTKFGDAYPLLVDSQREVESAKRWAKKHRLVVLRPAVPSDVRLERRLAAQRVAAQAAVMTQLPLPEMTPTASAAVQEEAAVPARVPFLQYLTEMDKKKPCPPSRDEREVWLLSMSSLYQYNL